MDNSAALLMSAMRWFQVLRRLLIRGRESIWFVSLLTGWGTKFIERIGMTQGEIAQVLERRP